MTQTHYLLRALKGATRPDKDVQVRFSTSPNGRAVLFIHGFSGDAVTTWSDFSNLLPARARCAGSDIYFYGYDGLRADLNASAAIFRGFLDRMMDSPQSVLPGNVPQAAGRAADFSYSELLIVAHSLGAVIARRALVDATRMRLCWAEKTRLVLYAPAHCGARVVALAIEASSGIPVVKHFAALAQWFSPLIADLRPGSPVLTALLNDTLRETQGGANPHLNARRVVLAEYEDIVENLQFGNDPPPVAVPGTKHTTVCKPRSDFADPIQLLESCL
jgi:pimeloyl-ACP methyl ester carboxylesterase